MKIFTKKLMGLILAITVMAVVLNICLVSQNVAAMDKDSNTDYSEKDEMVLDCGFEVHVHNTECFDENLNIACGYADFVVHSHDENCYDSEGGLVCAFPEIDEHVHSEECYGEVESTIDGGASDIETDVDLNNEDIDNKDINNEDMNEGDMVIIIDEPVPINKAEGEKELICQKEEIICHTHTEECFDGEGKVICGRMQVLRHQHTRECFRVVKAEKPAKANTINSINSQKTSSVSKTTSQITANAQTTEYSEPTESGKLFWAFCIFGILILISAAVICCLGYRCKRKQGERKD